MYFLEVRDLGLHLESDPAGQVGACGSAFKGVPGESSDLPKGKLLEQLLCKADSWAPSQIF